MTNWTLALNIIGYAALIIGAGLTLKSKIKTDNLSDLKERVEILEKEREYAREQHIENQKAIANLEGQLQTYKEIPLRQIATSLEGLSESNKNILKVLESTATIAAIDRDTLLNPTQHVEIQEVEKQVIKNTEVK